MDIVRILKRKDASSVVVAIALGLFVEQAVGAWASRPAEWLAGANSGGGGWRANFWGPLWLLLIELLVLELLIRLYVMLAKSQNSK